MVTLNLDTLVEPGYPQPGCPVTRSTPVEHGYPPHAAKLNYSFLLEASPLPPKCNVGQTHPAGGVKKKRLRDTAHQHCIKGGKGGGGCNKNCS